MPDTLTEVTVADIATSLRSYRFLAVDEAELQDQIAEVLTRAGIHHVRELTLTHHGRIDFMLDHGIGLEVKVDGSPSAVLRQLFGYAQSPSVESLVLVTRRSQLSTLRGPIAGKTLHVIHIGGGLL